MVAAIDEVMRIRPAPRCTMSRDASLARCTTDSQLSWSALEATLNVRAVARVSRDFSPWIQVGAGGYRVASHLRVPAVQLQVDGASARFGYVGCVGFDLPAFTHVAFGVDASYHYLLWKDASGANLTVFTVGLHLARQLR